MVHRLGLDTVRLPGPERYERLRAVGLPAALPAQYVGRDMERQGHARRFTTGTCRTESRCELSCLDLGLPALHEGIRDGCALPRNSCSIAKKR